MRGGDPAVETPLPARHLLRWFYRRNLRWLAGGAVAGSAWRLTVFAIPLFIGLAIDLGLQQEDIGATLRWSAAAFGAAVLVALFDALRHWCADMGYYTALSDMRIRLFEHLQSRDLRWHSRHGVGRLLGAFNSDLPHFGSFIAEFPTAVSGVLMLVVTTTVLFIVDPLLGVIALGTIPAIVVVVVVAGPGVHVRADDLQSGTAAVTETVEESLENIVLVKSFGLEDARIATLQQVGDRLVSNAVAYERTQATLLGASGLIPATAIGVGLLIGGDRVIANRMSLGELVAFTTWMALYATIVETLVQRAGGLIRFNTAVRRVEALIAEAPVLPQAGAPALPAAEGMLALAAATLEDAGRPVLAPVTFEIPHGGRVLVTGPSGSGKSALFSLLARQCDPASGSVTWAGADLRSLDLPAYRRRVALVGESAFLFDATLRENITLSHPAATEAEIHEALRIADASEIVAALPGGLETPIGATGRELSGGQRQRLALARALLARPTVLLLDDALSAVDAPTEQAILANLAGWEGAIVFATHRPGAIEGDRLVRLTVDRGHVSGAHLPTAPAPREATPSGSAPR